MKEPENQATSLPLQNHGQHITQRPLSDSSSHQLSVWQIVGLSSLLIPVDMSMIAVQ